MTREEMQNKRENLSNIIVEIIIDDLLNNIRYDGKIVDDDRACHLCNDDLLEIKNNVYEATFMPVVVSYNGAFTYDWKIA